MMLNLMAKGAKKRADAATLRHDNAKICKGHGVQ